MKWQLPEMPNYTPQLSHFTQNTSKLSVRITGTGKNEYFEKQDSYQSLLHNFTYIPFLKWQNRSGTVGEWSLRGVEERRQVWLWKNKQQGNPSNVAACVLAVVVTEPVHGIKPYRTHTHTQLLRSE
jgi:hypothetical protein